MEHGNQGLIWGSWETEIGFGAWIVQFVVEKNGEYVDTIYELKVESRYYFMHCDPIENKQTLMF